MDDQNMSLLNYMGVTAALVIFAGPKPQPRGYLAKVGPAPLRYRAPALPPEMIIPLPPLAMTNEVEKIAPAETAASTNEPPAQTVTIATNAPVVAAPVSGESPLTPQMFVQFFNKDGSSNAPVSVIAPIPFSPPPSSIPAPPSRATYQTK